MDERQRRLWAGAEAGAIGFGGVAAAARATGMAISTVAIGRDEGRGGAKPSDVVTVRRSSGTPRCRDLSFVIFRPHRCFLLMKAHHISCTHLVRDGGEIRVAVDPTDGRAVVTTVDGQLRITGEQLLLTDNRDPPLHPSSSFVMKVIHEVTTIITTSSEPRVRAAGLETIRAATALLRERWVTDAAYWSLFYQLAAAEPVFEPVAERLRVAESYNRDGWP